MNTRKAFSLFVPIILVLIVGCRSDRHAATPAGDAQKPQIQTTRRTQAIFTADNNPTTLAGRGAPSLEDQFRPAAWIFLNGHEGKYTEVNGSPHLEWVIEQPVSTDPTFRVGVFPPLLGEPDEFKCVLQSMETADGSKLMYGISSNKGSFEFGREYSLLNPGEGFTVRNLMTGDVVSRISDLPEGRYLMAGGIENTKTGAKTPAVTFFTVAE